MKVFKKSLAAVASAIVMASSVCSGGYQPLIGNPNTVSARSTSISNEMKYGDYLYYEKVDEDADGTYDYIEITDCDESAVSVKIPSEIDGVPVTVIVDNAFSDCTSLTSVVIPDSVTSIEPSAFSGCTSLTSVVIPDSVTEIGYDAFYRTPLLNNQTGVKYAGKWVIGCDKDVTKAEIKSGTKEIADGAFIHCTSLESVVIPDSVTYIGHSAFSWCESLKSVVIPNGVTEIGKLAFSDCTNLESVAIPDSVTSIGNWAFSYCNGLTSINVSENNPNYSSSYGILFDKNKKELLKCPADINLTEYIIPDSVTYIGNGAFSWCTSLTSVVIPNSVTSIEGGAFWGCTSLTNIEIPDSVTSIEREAFLLCTSLTSVVIPNSVTYIKNNTFTCCNSLKSVVIPDSVAYIGDDAFSQCESLTSITIKNPECYIEDREYTICNGYDEYGKNDNAYFNGTIYGYENSTAQAYAEKWGYTFKEIGSEPPVTTTPTIIGDISGNGKIDLSDAIIIAQFILGKITFTDEERVIADINKDGRINLLDAIVIAGYILQDMKK